METWIRQFSHITLPLHRKNKFPIKSKSWEIIQGFSVNATKNECINFFKKLALIKKERNNPAIFFVIWILFPYIANSLD